MRLLLAVLASAFLVGCGVGGKADPEAACRSQGYQPGEEAWDVCIGAGGAAIATGPGSAYMSEKLEE